jgi:hypothetical protein
MRKNIKRSAVVGGTVAAVFGVGIGFAAWTNYGEGSGSVTAASAQPLTVTVSNVSGLFPTGSVDVPFTVTNTNDYDVTLSKAELKTVTVDAAHSACTTSVVTGSDVTLSDVVASGATSASQNFTLSMSNGATDACQGAVFTVTLGVTGLSS